MSEPRSFACWRCGRTFATEQTEEEVLAEMRQRFGDVPTDEQESLCDDCETEYMNRVVGEGPKR
jgi:hypothetical protein